MSADLERDLRALAHTADWPATPDLTAAVTARLGEEGPLPKRARLPHRRRLVAGLAAALVLVPGGGAVAFPDTRDDVLEWLGLRSVEVREAPELPRGTRRPLPAELGARVGLADAERRAGFAPVVPPALGLPEEVRVNRLGVVTLVYDGGATLLAELRGRLDARLVRKVVVPGTRLRRVPGGFLVSGPEHAYLYVRPGGEIAEDRPFLAADTLVLQRGSLLLRLERRGLDEREGRRLLGG